VREAKEGEEALSGGSGKVLDWEAVKAVVEKGEVGGKGESLPVILAGGLTPENVSAVVRIAKPWAVDVSGGVETADGTTKDLEKVEAFINAAKHFELQEVEAETLEVVEDVEDKASVEE